MPFNRDQSTAIRRKGREKRASSCSVANLQVNSLLSNFQGQVDNVMRSLTDQLEEEDALDAGGAPPGGRAAYAMATSHGYKDEHDDDAAYLPLAPSTGKVSRLMLIDKQVSPEGHLANAALDTVTVIKYDSKDTTLEELLELIRFAHRKQGFPFTSIACAQHGPDEDGLWVWTSDLVIDLGGGSPLSPITQLTPVVEALGMALEKTRMGRAHIDFLACGLAGFAPRLVLGLEELYGIDFRASTDDTGNDVNGGDWKMETDDDYDVAVDYLDRVKLVAYTEKMAGTTKGRQKLAKKLAAVPIGIAYTDKFDEDFRDWMIKQGGFTQAMRKAACVARRGIRVVIGKKSPLTIEHLEKCLAAAKKARPEEVAAPDTAQAYGLTMTLGTAKQPRKTATAVPPTLAETTLKADVPACSGGCAYAPKSCPNAHGANSSVSYKTSDVKACIKLDHTSDPVQKWLSQYRFMHVLERKYDHVCVNVSGWAQLVTAAPHVVLAPIVCYYMIGKDAPPLKGVLKDYPAGATHFTWKELLAVAPEAEQHVWFRNCANGKNYEVQLSWSSPIVSY